MTGFFFRNSYCDGVVVFLVFFFSLLSWLLHCYAMGGWSFFYSYTIGSCVVLCCALACLSDFVLSCLG